MKSAVAVFEAGDVLYGRLRPYLNKVVRPAFPGAASAEFIVFSGNDQIDAAFLHRLLMQPAFVKFASHINRGDRPRVDFDQIGEFPLGLPPISEQRRIVTKLDILFKHSTSAREELARVPRLIERYKQAIFGAAFRGLLTAEWRLVHAREIKTPTEQVIQDSLARLSENMGVKPWKPREYKDYPSLDIPECWRAARVCDVALHRSGVAYKSERFGASGTQVVRLGNLYQGRLDLGRSPVFIAEPTREDGAFTAKAGDILVSQTGTRYKRDYGNCVLLDSDEQEVFVNQRILCLSPTESVLPKFLAYYGNTPSFRNFFFNQETGGVNQGNVGVGGVMDVPCPLPSLAEQREIVHRVDAAIGIVDRIFADVTRALTLVERLDQATLAKAFRGELVEPQRTVEKKMVISQ
jgi:type I restriction enzyme S subunit